MPNSNKENMQKKSRKYLYAAVAIIAALIIIGSVYYFETTQIHVISGTPLDLYEGEITATTYGFGNTSSSLTSNPGPTITLISGKT